MQLNTMSSNVVLNNTGKKTSFGICQNAKMFKVLSDTMYKNKIGSIAREISCNALDSHVAAGTPDLPFYIHLPDAFEPYFSIRDYGIGLNDEQVRSVFAMYGESTKNDDNTQIGAFGLGGKTPFSYTDAFTIVSIQDGIKRVYSACISAEGFPEIVGMGETATIEGNGVEINIPVTKPDDYSKFAREVRDQLRFFEVKPVIDNDVDEIVNFLDYKSSGSNFMECQDVFFGGHSSPLRGVWIVQGAVGYPMDLELVKNNLSEENAEFLSIIQSSAIIRFDLGEIEVIASREGVSYTKYTFDNIERKLDNVRLNIKDTVKSNIDAFPDSWAKAMALYNDDTLRQLASSTKAGFDAPCYYRTSGMYYVDLQKLCDLSDDTTAKLESDTDTEYDYTIGGGLVFQQYKYEVVRRLGRWKPFVVARNMKIDSSVHIIFRDTADKPIVRLREAMVDFSRHTQMFVVENRDGSVITQEQKDAIIDRLGETVTAVAVSLAGIDLPSPEARASRPGYKPATAYTYDKDDDSRSVRHWVREYSKLKDWEGGAYYLIVDRLNIYTTDDERVVMELANNGLLDRPITAIREKDVAKIQDNSSWVPLSVKAKEVIEQILNNKTLINACAIINSKFKTCDFLDDNVTVLVKDLGINMERDNVFNKLCGIHHTVEKLQARSIARGYNSIAMKVFKLKAPPVDTTSLTSIISNRMAAIENEIKTKYPLLSLIRSSYVTDGNGMMVRQISPELKTHAIDYIKAFSA